PTYPQLNPYINVIDEKTFETGNKNLDPELTGKVEVSHSYSIKNFRLFSHLYYSDASDFIVQVSYLIPPDTLVMTYANGDWLRKAGGGVDGTVDVGRWMTVQTGISLWYSKSAGSFNGVDLSSEGVSWGFSLKASFFPWKQGEILGTFSYSSPSYLPEFYLHELHTTDMGVRQSFFDRKLTVSLTLTDLFNSRKWIVETTNDQFTLFNESKTDSRVLWVGLSWSMQATTQQKGKKAAPSETEEGLIRVGQ
ncbi:MAG: TonB-dependent receptor family protein, partial [Bacteroidales bacterium]|nr:TonB-dependent receptor family protein [Bacteroidales bacterium]